MPFLKFSRDKRGYEHFYLIEPGRRGRSHARILFWFRTPPQVKVGRAPFPGDVRRAIETGNPGLTFDWARLMATPIPPPDTSGNWRERGRAERAARRAARAEEPQPSEAAEPGEIESRARADVPAAPVALTSESEGQPTPAANLVQGPPDPGRGRRRRRRRRGRGPRGEGAATPQNGVAPPQNGAADEPKPANPAEPGLPTDEV